MQRIDASEGSTIEIAGIPVSVAYSRSGRLVAYVVTEVTETAQDTAAAAQAERERLTAVDKIVQNSGQVAACTIPTLTAGPSC